MQRPKAVTCGEFEKASWEFEKASGEFKKGLWGIRKGQRAFREASATSVHARMTTPAMCGASTPNPGTSNERSRVPVPSVRAAGAAAAPPPPLPPPPSRPPPCATKAPLRRSVPSVSRVRWQPSAATSCSGLNTCWPNLSSPGSCRARGQNVRTMRARASLEHPFHCACARHSHTHTRGIELVDTHRCA
eukprot:360359-Chlamydomonas_euryale.AAC.4